MGFFMMPGEPKPKKVKSKTNEASIQDKIIEHLDDSGWMVIRFNSVSLPDLRGVLVYGYLIHGIVTIPIPDRWKAWTGFPDVVGFRQTPWGTQCLLLEVKKNTKSEKRESQLLFKKFAANYFGIPVHFVTSVEDVENIDPAKRADRIP